MREMMLSSGSVQDFIEVSAAMLTPGLQELLSRGRHLEPESYLRTVTRNS
jgi:hypothetical protein